VRYPDFVALRRRLWDEFEARLTAARSRPRQLEHGDLETLAVQYRQVLHDHALTAARYPGTGAADRLRRLVLEGTHWLRRDRADRRWSPGHFIRYAFPRAFRRHGPQIGLAAALFLSTAAFGLVMTSVQPAIGTALLGVDRVEGLRDGHLWTESLTSAVPPSYSSSLIATNNMSVALAAWAGGALAGLGTLYVVVLNGYMLGSIVAVTVHYRMAPALLEFVAAHGPLEITLILVCAGAGLGVARALVVAQDRPRWTVVREQAAQSLVVLVGCLPWFLLLGAVEGFLSPSPDYPPTFKLAVGIALEALFLVVALRPDGAGKGAA